MTGNQFLSLLCFLILTGCSSNEKSITSAQKSGAQSGPETQVLQSTDIPVVTDMSCVDSNYPDSENIDVNSIEYSPVNFPNVDITKKCSFSGSISDGENYQHAITSDLVFCLVPNSIMTNKENLGWEMIISDTLPGRCDRDSSNHANFGPVVTNPQRGNTLFYIEGWQFQDTDLSIKTDSSQSFPYLRTFHMVLDRESYETVWYQGRCYNWGIEEDCVRATQSSVDEHILHTNASILITKLKFKPSSLDDMAGISYMEFKFEVYLP
jgi:hypothetical protein